ncbi:transposase DDE domain-containing protein [Candidatus Thiomargarita nelsonii]|uniref:Transposase DDE domain-containing protein n=1 Tax=Candidatus Thiomargarita nelsonii TaxID=1003181 RepID=A0A176S5T4_9GAMM|nr:transposase DDE domain-containing protein [Candidatus Thiomargarita nelsonii]
MLALHPSSAYEVDLAMEHIKHAQNDDMILFDRNYSSYRFLASLIDLNIQFTGRCSRQSFKAAQRLFKQSVTDSSTVTLFAKGEVKKKCKKLGFPTKITVRFVRVRLSTGEIEVLVTSLLDEKQYTAHMFKELQRKMFLRISTRKNIFL